jgi:hypothetical protein
MAKQTLPTPAVLMQGKRFRETLMHGIHQTLSHVVHACHLYISKPVTNRISSRNSLSSHNNHCMGHTECGMVIARTVHDFHNRLLNKRQTGVRGIDDG